MLGAGCWVLGAGCWVLGAGCWVLGAGCWVLGAGCWVLGAGCLMTRSINPVSVANTIGRISFSGITRIEGTLDAILCLAS